MVETKWGDSELPQIDHLVGMWRSCDRLQGQVDRVVGPLASGYPGGTMLR
jgi:hypothetical protein